MANPDLYKILEVEPTVSPDELKKSYRRLARQYHPDNNPGDPAAEARFKEVSQAYEILSDPERRANYDRFGSDGGAGNPFGAGSVQDIFDMFFGNISGRTQGRRGPQPGPDAEVTVDITLDDAAFGATHEVSVTLPQRCTTCNGSGCAPGTSPVTCVECAGMTRSQGSRAIQPGCCRTISSPRTRFCWRPYGFLTPSSTSGSAPCSNIKGDSRRSARSVTTPFLSTRNKFARLNSRSASGAGRS